MDAKLIKDIIDEIDDSCIVSHTVYSIVFSFHGVNPYKIVLYESHGVSVVKCYSYMGNGVVFARQFHDDRWL